MKVFKKILAKLSGGDRQKWLEEAGVTCWPGNNWDDVNSFKALRHSWRCLRTRKKTGVDPRDCYSMDISLYQWLYTHLCQLEHDTNCDLEAHKFEHNGKTYTEGEYIAYLKSLLLKLMKFDEFDGCPDLKWADGDGSTVESSEEEKREFMDVWTKNYEKAESLRHEMFNVLYELLPHLWW